MKDIMEKVTKMNHIYFHTIPSKKFKTITIVVKWRGLLQRQTITKRALLPFLFLQGTKSYPSEKQLMKKLDELYGAVLTIDGVKKGNYHVINFRLEVVNQKFIHNETAVLEESLQLLQEILFEPHLKGEAFPEKIVEREKMTLKNKMNALFDNKISYANMRLVEEMCQGERFGIRSMGYEEDLQSINGKNMYHYYRSILDEDRMDMYIIGDFDVPQMEKTLTSIFRRHQSSPSNIGDNKYSMRSNEPKELKETQSIQQAKLHIGYRTNCTYKDEGYFALTVFNGLFGGYPSSKLFMNVREKNSLAYYVVSRIESHIGLLIVYSGIEANNYEKTRDIIADQLKDIQKGKFTEAEVKDVKELIISEIRETLDHPSGSIELLYQQVIGNRKISLNEIIDQIRKVRKADVIEVASNINLDTIYLLTNNGDDHVEKSNI